MAGQSTEAAEFVEQRKLQKLEADQGSIKTGSVVALRREIDILVFPGCVFFHLLEKEPGDDIETAEAAANMAGAGIGDHVEGIDAADFRKEARANKWSGCRGHDAPDFLQGDVGEILHE